MKVLYITNLPSPYRVRFFSELGKLCDLTVIYERKSASDRNIKWVEDSLNTYKEIYLKGYDMGTDNSIKFQICKHLKKSYDHIIVGMYSTYTAMIAIIFMKLFNIHFGISTDGGFIKDETSLKFLYKKFLIGAANFWFSPSEMTTKYLLHYGAKKERIFLYPFSSVKKVELLQFPASEYNKISMRTKLNINETFIIISVGQLIHRKGFDILLKASVEFDKSIGIYIIGGKPSEEINSFVVNNNLENVHFLDFMGTEELRDYYMASDLFVLPTREDIWGLVVHEAMCFGLPVITTNKCLAGLELIKDGINGYIVEVENSSELRIAINNIYNDSNKVEIFGAENLKKAREYTIEKMAERYYEIFNLLNIL